MKLQDIRSNIRFLVFGDSTNTDFSDTDIDRSINNWYEKILNWAIQANGDWEINGEIATTDIIAGQRDYTFDSSFIKIKEVYIKSNDGEETVYVKAKKIDVSMINGDPENYHPTYPEYDLSDNQIYIFIPDTDITDVADGIKIYAQSDLVKLINDDDAPNLPELVTSVIYYGAADEYCIAQELYTKSAKLEAKIFGDPQVIDDKGMKDDLMQYFSSRFNNPVIMKGVKRNYI